ncbi:hypothetical protein ANN_10607 [Periplaneta americana]|uniref:Uncharacterized protein n=1 Tax=Periplaneta americana TaxID=6978 RepID=A0ABQ8TPG5_PERAM|nr:hypothetical protein ANN_10607 [Periplaneta americana]
MAGLCEGGNEPSGSLKAICDRNSISSKTSSDTVRREIFCNFILRYRMYQLVPTATGWMDGIAPFPRRHNNTKKMAFIACILVMSAIQVVFTVPRRILENSYDEYLTAMCLNSIAVKLFAAERTLVLSYPSTDILLPELTPQESVLQYMDSTLNILQEEMLWPLQVYRLNSSVKDTHYFLNGFYVIFVDFTHGVENVYSSFYTQYQVIVSSNSWSLRRTLVVLVRSFSADIMPTARIISGFMWKSLRMSKIIFLIPNYSSSNVSRAQYLLKTNNLDVFTWFPYSTECYNTDDIQLIGQCSLSNNTFSENVELLRNNVPEDLNGCPIIAEVKEDYLHDVKIDKHIGIFYQGFLAQLMNVTLKFNQINDTSLSSDIYGSLSIFSEEAEQIFDPTVPIVSCDMRWYIPCPKSLPRTDRILDVFSLGVWVSTIGVVFLSAVVMWRSAIAHLFSIHESHTYRTLSSSLVNVLSVTMSVSVPTLPKIPCLRTFFLLLVAFSLILSTVFQCFFVSFLVSPGLSDHISTFDQLLRSGLKIAVPSELDISMEVLYKDVDFKVFSSNGSVCSDRDDCLRRLFTVEDVATNSRDAQIYIARRMGIIQHTDELLCSLDEKISTTSYMFLLRRNSPIAIGLTLSPILQNSYDEYLTALCLQRIAVKLFAAERTLVLSYPSTDILLPELTSQESVLQYMDSTLNIVQQEMLLPLQVYRMNSSVKDTHYFLNGFYVIFVDFTHGIEKVLSSFYNQYQVIVSSNSWSERRTLVVLVRSFNSEIMPTARLISSSMWKTFGLSNIIFLIPHYSSSNVSRAQYLLESNNLDVFTWFPHSKECYNPDDIQLIGQCSLSNNTFSENVEVLRNNIPQDLNGCPIIVRIREGDLTDVNIDKYIGILYQGFLAQLMNTTLEFIPIDDTSEDRPPTDFYGSLNIFTEEMTPVFDPTVPIVSCDMRWYIPCPKSLPRTDRILDVFSLGVWVSTIGVVFLSAVVMWRSAIAHLVSIHESHTYRTLSSSLINVLSVTMSVSVPTLPKTPCLRVFFLLLVVFSLILSTVFQCFFVSFLVSPGLSDHISTFDQLLRSGLKIAVPPELTNLLGILYKDVDFKVFSSNGSVCSDRDDCLGRLLTVEDVATITNSRDAQIYMARRMGIIQHADELICALAEKISTTSYMFILRRNSPIADRFNDCRLSPGLPNHISTFDQLLRSGLKIAVPPELTILLKALYKDVNFKVFSSNGSVCSDRDDCLRRLLTVEDVASITSAKDAQIYMARRMSIIQHSDEFLCSLDLKIFSTSYMFLLRRNSPITDRFNTVAIRCLEAGLIDKHYEKILKTLKSTHEDKPAA